MAGIGWKLERMLARDTLTSTVQAYLTGVVVTSAPWLLTTMMLVTLRVLGRDRSSLEFVPVEQLITVTYAVTLILSAPIHVVISRFTADRLYERRLDLIAVPLRSALTFTLVVFLAIGGATMVVLQVPFALAMPGVLLTALVAAQWLLLAIGGGMSSPAGVLGAFAAGAGISIVAALGLERAAGFGARGYLVGFTLGQAVALVGMLLQILRSLPNDESPLPRGSLLAAVREYRLLAVSAVAVYSAIWVDKIVVWLFCGTAKASALATATSLAWFVVIPTFGWIYLQVETSFYKVFRRYYRGIESGAGLAELEASAMAVLSETRRLIRGAMVVQLVVTMVGMLATTHVVRALELPSTAMLSLRLTLVAASFQVMTLLGLLLLYYFDLRREAVKVALVKVMAIGVATLIAIAMDLPPAVGTAVGSIAPAIYALGVVHRSVGGLIPHTFQAQPYGCT